MYTTTIKELGPKLPIGRIQGNTLLKDFSLRPYKSRIDRFMNIWREQNEGQHQALLSAKFLSLVVESFAGEALPLIAEGKEKGNSTPEVMLKVLDWYWADAMYVYLYSRITTLSEFIEVPFACPMSKCGFKGMLKPNLLTTEVVVMESPEELFHWVKMRRGFKVNQNKHHVQELKLQPVKFKTLLAPGAVMEGVESLGYNQFRDSIAELKGVDRNYVITDEEIDEIERIDTLMVDRQAGKVSAGPKLRTTLECPKDKCGGRIINALDWSFDSFFDSSVPLGELMT